MKWVIPGVVLVSATVLGVYFLADVVRRGEAGPYTSIEEIKSLFDSHDSREAYEMFKRGAAELSLNEQHSAAHIVGEVLYAKEGLKGFSICDGSFGFGCFHSFISFAIAQHGDDVVRELDAACVTTYGVLGLGCSHGIGHGVMSHEGYDEEALEKALALCEPLSWKHPYGGCRDGAFMEYNFRVMEPDPKDRFRPFVSSERHVPCASLPAASQSACYFNQPAWWEQALRGEENVPVRLAGFCGEAEGTPAKRACFRGIGHAYASLVSFDASRGIAACDELAVAGEKEVWCREGLAWALYADPVFRPKAESACTEGLRKEEATQCLNEYLFAIQ